MSAHVGTGYAADSGAAVSGRGDSNVSTNANMEALLEQLRAKSRSHPTDTWNEFAKQIRMSSLDLSKQFQDATVVHEALEKLQNVMAANSLAQLLERIHSACQSNGLKFNEQGSTVYISTDAFYIDLQCDSTPNNQSVREVRVTHHGNNKSLSVPAMTEALRQSNVRLFMDHIKGLLDMYNIEGDISVKTKYFIVQQSLEFDIEKMNKVQMQQYQSKNLGSYIYKLPLGLVQHGVAGLPTKLTFFITPYDFLSEKEETTLPITLECIQSLDLGVSATVGIEQTPTNHQLQTIPLSNYVRSVDNRLGTQFVPVTSINSVLIPAAFLLKLAKPIALSEHTIRQIEKLQGAVSFGDTLTMKPMLDAIVESSGGRAAPGTKKFTVVLPGQVQNYYINELKTGDEVMQGALVSKVPFTHPTFMPPAITLLRQQLMVNTMVLSCVRSGTQGKGETKPVDMELKVVTNQLLTVTFQHPFADSVATVDFDITDASAPKCSVFCNVGEICTNSHASLVMQRCFSIPITMRAILKQAGQQEENLPPPTKKVKVDHGDIMQAICDVYTTMGHYIPYGSVNTASADYTKNIETNKYSLCLRRFSGYKRSCFTTLNSLNALASVLAKPSIVPVHAISNQPTSKIRPTNTPMLSSLLDEKDSQFADVKPPAHPLGFEPTQDTIPQQYQALTDLLAGPEGHNASVAAAIAADKKAKKARFSQKRRPSDVSITPPLGAPPVSAPLSAGAVSAPLSAGAVSAPLSAGAVKKRKKSDTDELTAKVKVEVSDFWPSNTASSSHVVKVKTEPCIPVAPSQPIAATGRPVVSKASVAADSQLAHLLLYNMGEEKKARSGAKPKVVTLGVENFFDSPKQMKQEATCMQAEVKAAGSLQADVKGQATVSIKPVRSKKAMDEKKVVKHSASADSIPRDKKLKRSDSVEMKLKETKSMDRMPSSPGKKAASGKASAKPKAKNVPKSESVPALSMKTTDDRASPKEKVKKQGSEKDKKRRTPKSPVSAEAAAKHSSQDVYAMGFYGASNLKSLPKIPKRKTGDSQASPTSPTLPPSLQQKSSAVLDWQRASPVLNRSMPNKPEELPAATVNRTKSYPPPQDASKRPALLPTPAIPPVPVSPHKTFQRKNINDVIHRLSQPGQASYSSPSVGGAVSGSQPPRYSAAILQKNRGVEPSPNSPDELSIVLDSRPVCIPTNAVVNDPASPDAELVTRTPKAIPLDPNKTSSDHAASSSGVVPKPILVKQKAVSRPLTFSPKPMSESRLDDDLMDLALGCN